MEQTWTYQNIQRTAPISEGVQLYVDLIGIDKTADLLLAVGGTPVSAAQFRSRGGLVAKAIGTEAAQIIGKETFGGNVKIPAGKPFLVRHLFAKGVGQAEIARRLHCDVLTVARTLIGNLNSRKKTP